MTAIRLVPVGRDGGFVALGLVHRRAGELPTELTGFVGRRAELAQLAGLLETARLITVTGPGGVGKTRVSLRAAALAANRYPDDGVCLVELSALRDPELLPHTVATGLGLPQTESQLDAVLDYLHDRKLLLILDTCEHLLDACAMLADAILRAAPGVTVLATSRQPLDVPGEHTCPVPPLPVPDQHSPACDATGDAVELFAQRAAAAVPGFALTAANRADGIRLCRAAGGDPLDQLIPLVISDTDDLEVAGPLLASANKPDPLTSREHEIAALVADGLSNREIAARLIISKRTVDAHVEHIYAKLGISSRVQLANWLRPWT